MSLLVMLCSAGLQVLRVPHRVGHPQDVPLGGCWSPCPCPVDDAGPSGSVGAGGTPGLVTQRRGTHRLVPVLVPVPGTLSSAGLWALQVPGVGAMQSHAVSVSLLPESLRALRDEISQLLAEGTTAAAVVEQEAAEATRLGDEISPARGAAAPAQAGAQP